MALGYDRVRDRLVGHDYPGVRGSGFVQYELDELELGARVAIAIDDPEQAWWEMVGYHYLRLEEEQWNKASQGEESFQSLSTTA